MRRRPLQMTHYFCGRSRTPRVSKTVERPQLLLLIPLQTRLSTEGASWLRLLCVRWRRKNVTRSSSAPHVHYEAYWIANANCTSLHHRSINTSGVVVQPDDRLHHTCVFCACVRIEVDDHASYVARRHRHGWPRLATYDA